MTLLLLVRGKMKSVFFPPGRDYDLTGDKNKPPLAYYRSEHNSFLKRDMLSNTSDFSHLTSIED